MKRNLLFLLVFVGLLLASAMLGLILAYAVSSGSWFIIIVLGLLVAAAIARTKV